MLIVLMLMSQTLVSIRFQGNQRALQNTCEACHGCSNIDVKACEVQDSMSDLYILLYHLALERPFCFAHFNDGEIIAITNNAGVTDRGMQNLSPELSREMKSAIKSDYAGMFFGLPCALEFPAARHTALSLVNDFVNTKIVPATVFINHNYKVAHTYVVKILQKRCVYMVVSERANLTLFKELTGVNPRKVYTVPTKNAFDVYVRMQKLWAAIPDGAVVVFCAGPLGRILSVEWFKHQPRATMLEVGSFFDMELHGKSFGANYYTDSSVRPCNHPHGNTSSTKLRQLQCIDECLGSATTVPCHRNRATHFAF